MSQTSVVQKIEIDDKSFSIIEGKFRYLLPSDVLKWGEIELHFADGSIWSTQNILELFDCLSAIAWAEPTGPSEFLGTDGRKKWLEALQAKQKELVRRKYGDQGRKKSEPEEVKSETINVEDLGL